MAGLLQPTLSKSHGSRGFSISGLPGLTQRGTLHLLLHVHVAGEFSFHAKSPRLSSSVAVTSISASACYPELRVVSPITDFVGMVIGIHTIDLANDSPLRLVDELDVKSIQFAFLFAPTHVYCTASWKLREWEMLLTESAAEIVMDWTPLGVPGFVVAGFFGEEELQPANESRLAARKTVRRLARISR